MRQKLRLPPWTLQCREADSEEVNSSVHRVSGCGGSVMTVLTWVDRGVREGLSEGVTFKITKRFGTERGS